MFEWLMIAAAVFVMVKAADAEGRSSVLWGFLTFGICMVCRVIPLPLVRILIAAVISYGAMFVHKLISER